MSIAKDKAIKKNLNDFDHVSKLTLNQIELVKLIINNINDNVIYSNTLKQIRKNEKKLDNFDVKISEKIINVVVLYNPVASELRNLMAGFRIITNLERIGDLIIKIVNTIKKLNDDRLLLLNLDDINKMLDLAYEMVLKSSLSFINKDKEVAIWVINNDISVDKLNRHISRNSLLAEEVLSEINKVILDYSSLRIIISSIERIADHATHIAEASVFALIGKDIRHKGIY